MPESVVDRCTRAHEYIFHFSKKAKYYFDHIAIQEDFVSDHKSGNGFKRSARKRSARVSYQNQDGTARGNEDQWDEVGGKRNKRSVWTVNTKPFSEAHFATFPEELITPCILAGTSEKGVCPKCGKAWVRQVERGAPKRIGGATGCLKEDKASGPMDRNGQGQWDYGHLVKCRESNTIGWLPSCQCSCDPVPATVLDPFFGAGTTGLVSRKLLRNWIGIELNQDYINIANKRIGKIPARLDAFEAKA